MSLASLSIVTGLVKETVGFFFTTKKEKRKARMENLRSIITIMKDEKRTRSVMGWVITVVVLVAILYDIITNNGENFEILLTLFASVQGS